MNATIYHNARCGTSRKVLERLRNAGADVTVVDYIAHPPERDELVRLLGMAGLRPNDALRRKEPGAAALANADDETVLAAMLADPILIERPLVETNKGVRLCRPPDRLDEIL